MKGDTDEAAAVEQQQLPGWEGQQFPACATVPVDASPSEAPLTVARVATADGDATLCAPTTSATMTGGLLSLSELARIEDFLCTLPTTTVASSAAPTLFDSFDENTFSWPPSSSGSGPAGRPPQKAPLEAHEKRTRHVQAEHKRRNRIKDELGRMAQLISPDRHMVATAGADDDDKRKGTRKSQAKLMGQANDYIEQLVRENQRLRQIISVLYRPWQ